MIITAISILAAAGFATGGLAAVFCFAPDTAVKLADGGQRRIAELVIGDHLHGGGVVEGMYVMDGSQAQMYSINGIIVSGDHLVWHAAASAYCAVADHPAAIAVVNKYTHVYCPLISNRSLACCSPCAPEIWFRDWEEIEEESESAWHTMVERMLNPGRGEPEPEPLSPAATAGFAATVNVCTPAGQVPIRSIKIGDTVLTDCDKAKTTKVLGLTEIAGEFDAESGLGAATWIYDAAEKHWKHPAVTATSLKEGRLYNLITETGTFVIASTAATTVRDAFEVGLDGIKKTYSFTMSELLKTDSHPPNR